MTEGPPVVSVVIPTRNRPDLVLRAVRSALGQTFGQMEVVVVVDGPDRDTVATLGTIPDPRLRVLALEAPVGGSEARNAGVRASRGEWIALLDDDDEFLPRKIEKQLKAALASPTKYTLVTCYFITRSADLDIVWPRRLPGAGEPMSEYLFCRSSFTRGEGAFQTSTFFCQRELLLETPFAAGLKRHQDWDWLLKIGQRRDVSVVPVSEPLSIYHIVESLDSVSKSPDWRFSLRWAKENRNLITPRAFSFFVAAQVLPEAVETGEGVGTCLALLRECIFGGKPTPFALMLFAGYSLFPERIRTRVRTAFFKRKNRAPKG